MKPILRRLSSEDVSIFRRLRLEAFKTHPDAFGSSFDEFAARPIDDIKQWLTKSVALGAFTGDELVAIGAYFREDGAKMQHRAYVVSMYTAPTARRQGLSGEIIEHLAQLAEKDGIIQLHLGVSATNDAARRSYIKAGFETYGIEPRSLFVGGQYIDEELMVRFLGSRPDDKAPKGKTK